MQNKQAFFLLALLAGLCGLLAVLLHFYGGGHIANVYQNGLLIRSIDLTAVDAPYSFSVSDADGHTNVIAVEPGRICVSSASCPDQVCVNAGWRDGGADPIVCLPAKLVIRLEKTGKLLDEAADFDGVAG